MSFLRSISLDRLSTKGTKPFRLPGIYAPGSRDELTLLLRCADEHNSAWENERARIDATLKASATERQRFDAYLPAFASHVVAGWENANDEPYTPAALLEFMPRYADEAFDLARQPLLFAMNRNNFRDFSPPDAEELGKK